jgi:hypothetical protein
MALFRAGLEEPALGQESIDCDEHRLFHGGAVRMQQTPSALDVPD